MDSKNFIGMGLGALKGRLFGRRIPLNVMLSVTDRCNSRCAYCNIPQRGRKELSYAQIRALLNELGSLGCQRLGLWGGEPLIREDIKEIIDYAKSKGLFVTLDTNGYLLPEKLGDIEAADHLVLAFDGDEKAHDANREIGSHRKALRAIKCLKGRMPFWTITVLTRHNLGSIEYILHTAESNGFLVTFQLLHHNEKLSRNHASLIASGEDYRKAIKKIISLKRKGGPIVSSYKYLEHLLRWPDYAKPFCSKPVPNLRCQAGRLYCNIDTDGAVYPCSLLVDMISAPNFLKTGFKAAFESLDPRGCSSCIASCFTEYNLLYSLDIPTIMDWKGSLEAAKGGVCRTAD